MSDDVQQWAPLFTKYFKDEQIVKPEFMISGFDHGDWCKLCDAPVPRDEGKVKHIARHTRELKEWRKKRQAQAAKDAKARLAEVRREKKMTQRTLEED